MVLEQNNLEQKTKELDELINLAERVSSNIKSLRSKSKGNLTLSLLGFAIIAVSYYFVNSSPSLSSKDRNDFVIILFLLFWLISIALYTRNKVIKEAINEDYKILSKLHNMITTHKRSVDSDLGILSNTIYEMRLSRIEFNFDNASKNPFFRLITSILG